MTKKIDNRKRITMQVDDEILKLIRDLREVHCINISALFRDSITEWHKKLNPDK